MKIVYRKGRYITELQHVRTDEYDDSVTGLPIKEDIRLRAAAIAVEWSGFVNFIESLHALRLYCWMNPVHVSEVHVWKVED